MARNRWRMRLLVREDLLGQGPGGLRYVVPQLGHPSHSRPVRLRNDWYSERW